MKNISILLIYILLVTGCSQAHWNYTARKYRSQQSIAENIQILEFSDARSKTVNDSFKTRNFVLHWVPFVLWSNITEVSIPEGHLIEMSSMTEVLPKATQMELSSSGLFKNVTIMSENAVIAADYTLKGTIIETDSSKFISAYGLSFIGNTLSLLGVPSGLVKNSMTIKFTLLDKNNHIIFEKSYAENSLRPIFIYTELSNESFAKQTSVYQNINKRLIRDLRKIIRD